MGYLCIIIWIPLSSLKLTYTTRIDSLEAVLLPTKFPFPLLGLLSVLVPETLRVG